MRSFVLDVNRKLNIFAAAPIRFLSAHSAGSPEAPSADALRWGGAVALHLAPGTRRVPVIP
jgi:hypothetical protein